jgi:16S rRNA processing protein RimM
LTRALPVAGADGLLVGTIIGAQGLKGEVKVKSFTAEPECIGRYGPLFSEDGQSFQVASVRAQKGETVVVRFKGINDRSHAEALKGVRLYIPRAALPETRAGEFYHADLIGLRVEGADGKTLGIVRGIHNFGAGDVIEIDDGSGETTMLPFTREVVTQIDVAGGRIVAQPPRMSEN